MTRLCAAIFVHDIAQARRDIAAAIEAGADMIELRIDTLDRPQDIRRIISAFDLPMILTCRASYEGGHSALLDQERAAALTQAAPGNDRVWLDLEFPALQRVAITGLQNRLIVSSHDFTGRPPTLTRLYGDIASAPGDVAKIVWLARSIRDNIEAFEILQHRQKATIALCMGEAGLISRVLAKKFGAFLTFAGMTGESGTAPGQISVRDMKRLYRWDAIGPQTRVYGVVASPVAHSMSPAVHNAAFDHTSEDGVYLPMLVQPGYESFKAFMEEFPHYKPLHLRGLSITIPHKQNALRYLQEKGAQVEPLAIDIGAVNTIIIERDNAGDPLLRGINTDYQAIIQTICSSLQIQPEQLADYRVAVVGAGGTGRTAVAALASLGATVVVYNRTLERAQALADEFNGRPGKVVAARLEKICESCCQIYINTTSVGMHPNVNQSPMGDSLPKFTPDTLVFDTIYNPLRTRLLQQASEAGAKTVGGIEMFVRQAASQFTAWTDKSAPLAEMRRVIEQRLA